MPGWISTPRSQAFDGLLRPHVQYAIASWSTHDPATGLFTSCTMSGAPKDPVGEARLFRCEFTAGEPASYRSLIGQRGSAAILSEVTGGELNLASRYRDIFEPFGLTDELRAVLWADGTAWGSATLLRADGRFDARESRQCPRSPARRPTPSDSPSCGERRVGRKRWRNLRASSRSTRTGSVTPTTVPAEYWLDLVG